MFCYTTQDIAEQLRIIPRLFVAKGSVISVNGVNTANAVKTISVNKA